MIALARRAALGYGGRMQEFALEHPIVTLLIVVAMLSTLSAVVPWSRSGRDDEEG